MTKFICDWCGYEREVDDPEPPEGFVFKGNTFHGDGCLVCMSDPPPFIKFDIVPE